MKLAVFSDLHVTNKNSKFNINDDGISDLIGYQKAFVEWMCEDVRREDIDGVLFLGDFTDYSTLDPITATFANSIMSELVQLEKPTVLIGGNHTTSDQRARYTVLGAMRSLLGGGPGCPILVTEQGEVEFEELPGIIFYCFPYKSDLEELKADIVAENERLSHYESDSIRIMLFHFPCVNAQLDNGLKSPHGVELRQEDVSSFDLVLGGDFHRAQKLEGLDAAYYVGAPFDLKFNEQTDFKRGYVVVDTDTLELEWRENPYWFPMRSVEGSQVTWDYLDSLEFPERTILRVKGDLEPKILAEIESMGFYSFSHIRTRKKKLKEIDFMVSDSADDEKMVDEALDKYDASPEIKDRARGLFAVVKGRTG